MNVSRLRKEVQSIIDNIDDNFTNRGNRWAHDFINKYGYLLSAEQLRRLLWHPTIVAQPDYRRLFVESFAAYIDDEMLEQLPDWMVHQSRPLVMRISYERAHRIDPYDPNIAGMWISAKEARKRGIEYDDCGNIAVAHTAYRSIVSGTIRDRDIPAALEDAARYATATKLRKMVRAIYRRRLSIIRDAKYKKVSYGASENDWTHVFTSLVCDGYLAALPWQYAIRLAKAMLIQPYMNCNDRVHINFPEPLCTSHYAALVHHKLLAFLARIATNVLRIARYGYGRDRGGMCGWLQRTLRRGRLAAAISPRLRMYIGMSVPSIVNKFTFTASEIKRIRVVNKIEYVG